MRYLVLSILAIALSASFLLACNSATKPSATAQTPGKPNSVQTETTYADGARRITIAETNKLIKAGQAFVLDVRNQQAFDAGHIPGAKLIPAGEVINHVDELPRDKTIITYCSWPNEHTSAGAVVSLKSKGIENAAALLGGFVEWEKEGLPVERKQQ